MKRVLYLPGLLLFLLNVHAFPAENINDWENPAVFQKNQQEPHVPLTIYESIDQALFDSRDDSPYFTSLNGSWKFLWVPVPEEVPKDFFKPAFDSRQWDNIIVPGNWQTQGYGHPMFRNVSQTFYSDPPNVPHDYNPVGCYKRTFTIPPAWNNRHIFLHFEGVKSASYVWINGQEVGYNQGGMEPAEYDITPYIQEGENDIAVQVFRYSDGTYLEDQDMWRLAGIYRTVYLFSTPPSHIRDYYITTDLDNDYKDATLNIEFEIANYHRSTEQNNSVRIQLFDQEEKPVFSQPVQTEQITTEPENVSKILVQQQVTNPDKWSAEKPHLYTLVFELLDNNGQTLEVMSEKCGFREIEIIDRAVLVNGVPIKFNGVNSHVHHPLSGRTMDVDMMEKDITLMKQFNINCVRTSHYPPNPEYLDLADLYGLYIVDETGDEAHSNTYLSEDPAWKDAYIDRARKMVKRDRNHPSVIIWSAGNEAGSGDNIGTLIAEGKELDPSRPGWLYGGNRGRLAYEDIIGPRYPTHAELKKLAKEPAEIDPRPSFMDEYLAATGNSLGGLDEYWDIIYSSRRLTGGAIWDWVSPGLTRKLVITSDLSVNKIHGVLMGRSRLVKGKYGKAVALSGRDEWVELYRHPKLDITGTGLTLALWVYPRGWTGSNPLITKGDHQFVLQQSGKDSLEFFIYDSKKVILRAPTPSSWNNTWQHVTATFDGAILKLYINGDLVASKNHKGHITHNPFPINIGKNNELHGQDYPGQLSNAVIDHVRIFNLALSPNDIKKIMKKQDRELEQKAVLCLNFDKMEEKEDFFTLGIGGRAYGLVWPDRRIQPELWQLKKTPQPVLIEPFNLLAGKVKITNRFNFTNLIELTGSWQFSADDTILQEGSIDVNLDPGQSRIYTLPIKKPASEPGAEYWLLVSFTLREDKSWAALGHEVAWEQFKVPFSGHQMTEFENMATENIHLSQYELMATISGNDFVYLFDKTTGTFTSLKYKEKELLKAGPELTCWRAPLTNETDSWGSEISRQWRSAGLNRMQHRLEDIKVEAIDEKSIRLSVKKRSQAKESSFALESYYVYYILSSGDIIMNHSVIPEGEAPEWLPKIGIQLQVTDDFNCFTWYGRGPFETYQDRKTGAQVGIYSETIDDLYTDYLVPQDFGNLTDVRWAVLTNDSEIGLFVQGAQPLNVSASYYSTDNISRALYPFQLVKQKGITLNIDHKVTGVGGTPIPTLMQYRTLAQRYSYTVRLKPFSLEESDPITMGRQSIPKNYIH